MGSVVGCVGSAGTMFALWSALPGSLSNDSGSRLLTNWATSSWISRPRCERKEPASALPVHSWRPGTSLSVKWGGRRLNFGFGELIEIKHMFGISAAALVMRMRELGIITGATLRDIFGGIGSNWRADEPLPLEREESPTRFRRLCLRALAENEISESKAAELLRLRVSEIEGIMAGSAA